MEEFEKKVNKTYPEKNGYGEEYRKEIKKVKYLLVN